MDIELEEMEEGVVDEIDRTADVFLDAEEKFEGSSCFVTSRKGNVLELARG